jgi:hypothetical protein
MSIAHTRPVSEEAAENGASNNTRNSNEIIMPPTLSGEDNVLHIILPSRKITAAHEKMQNDYKGKKRKYWSFRMIKIK